MKHNWLRKCLVLLLTLTLVMGTFNVSFAIDDVGTSPEVATEETSVDTTEITQETPAAEENVVPAEEATEEVAPVEDTTEIDEEAQQNNAEDSSEEVKTDATMKAAPLAKKTSIKQATVTASEVVYNGESQTPKLTVKIGFKVGPLDFTETLNENEDYVIDELEPGKDAGTYSWKISGMGGYDNTKSGTWTLEKAMPTVRVEGFVDRPYTGQMMDLVQNCKTSYGVIEYKVGLFGDWTTEIPQAKDCYYDDSDFIHLIAGDYDIYYRVNGDGKNYSDYPTRTQFLGADTTIYPRVTSKITRANPNAKVVGYENLEYTGSPQVLINDKATTADFGRDTLQYSFDALDNYSSAIPTKTDAGTYNVFYHILQTDNWLLDAGTVPVTIAKKSIENDDITIQVADTLWKDVAVTPEVLVSDSGRADLNGDKLLTEGKDYTYTIQNSEGTTVEEATAAGTYTVAITGIGNYEGNVEKTWTVSTFTVNLEQASFEYDNTKHSVSVVVTDNEGPLTPDADYKILNNGDYESIQEATNAGTYHVYVQGINDYEEAGIRTLEWKITPASLEHGDVTIVRKSPLYIYDGTLKAVDVEVNHTFNSGTPIPLGVEDYEIVEEKSTTSETDAGTYTVTVQGKGNYTGEASVTWQILGFRTDWLVVSLNKRVFTYNGEVQTPDIKVGVLDSIGLPGLVEGKDYDCYITGTDSNDNEVKFEKDPDTGTFLDGPKDAGIYKVVVKGKNYFQDTKEIEYQIKPAEIKKDWVYTGRENALINAPDLQLLDGTNYDLPFLDLYQTGPQGFVLYSTGDDPGKQAIYVKHDGTGVFLKENVDYSIGGPTSSKGPGAWEITIKGKGNYTGTATCAWSIGTDVMASLSIDEHTPGSPNTIEYNGEKITPSVSVRLAGLGSFVQLNENEDYTLSGDVSKTNAGEYTIVITAKQGNKHGFNGKIEKKWIITKRNVKAEWDKTETVYNGKEQRPQLAFKHADELGATIGDDGIVEKGFEVPEAKAISLLPPKNAGVYEMAVLITGIDLRNYKFVDSNGIDIRSSKLFTTRWTIKQKEIALVGDKTEFEYDGKKHLPTVHATAIDETTGEDLLKNKIFLLKVEGAKTNAGNWTAIVSDILIDGKLIGDNYKLPEEATVPFTIKPRSITNPTFTVKDTVYDGTVKNPNVKGTDRLGLLDTRVLRNGRDYTYQIIDNVTGETVTDNVIQGGAYTVKITGIGNYGEDVSLLWNIGRLKQKDAKLHINGWICGSVPNAPKVTGVKDNAHVTYEYAVEGTPLVSNNWSVIPPMSVGNYVVKATIHETRNYEARVLTAKFIVDAIYYTSLAIDPIAEQLYTGSEIKPGIVVKDGGYTLREGSDYRISYSNNIEPGTATVKVVFIARYRGTYTTSFDIYGKPGSVMTVKAKSLKGPAVQLTWSKIEGADKYVVYGNRCGKKYKKIKTSEANTLTIKKIDGKKLVAHKSYKFYVVALDAEGNQLSKTKAIHYIVQKVSGKTANTVKITVNKKNVEMNVGDTFKIGAKLKIYKNKKHIKNNHGAKLRYTSNNTDVATVNSKGVITAVRPGPAKITVQDISGVKTTVQVTVK